MQTAEVANIKPVRKPRHVPDKKLLIELAAANPGLTLEQIGKIVNVDKSTVHRTLERYGCRKEHVDNYQEFRSDILAGLQDRLLAKITSKDIEKAGLRDKVVAFGILMDKQRLNDGLSTQNHAVIMASAVMEAEKMSKRPLDVVSGDNNEPPGSTTNDKH